MSKFVKLSDGKVVNVDVIGYLKPVTVHDVFLADWRTDYKAGLIGWDTLNAGSKNLSKKELEKVVIYEVGTTLIHSRGINGCDHYVFDVKPADGKKLMAAMGL